MKIKPCPKCGHPDSRVESHDGDYWRCCCHCGIATPPRSSARRATQTWNDRSPSPQDAGDEIDRLQAIVDRMQKDADGNPILPGDVGFALRFPALGGKPHIIQMRVDAIEIACIRSWKDGTARPEHFYRSREAAEKARKP